MKIVEMKNEFVRAYQHDFILTACKVSDSAINQYNVLSQKLARWSVINHNCPSKGIKLLCDKMSFQMCAIKPIVNPLLNSGFICKSKRTVFDYYLGIPFKYTYSVLTIKNLLKK